MVEVRVGRRTRLVPALAGGALVAAVAVTTVPAAVGSHAKAATPKLTLAKARADVVAARRPLAKFTGPTVSPGSVPTGKSVVSIYSVPAPLPQRSATGVANAAKAIGWSGKVVFGQGTRPGWPPQLHTRAPG